MVSKGVDIVQLVLSCCVVSADGAGMVKVFAVFLNALLDKKLLFETNVHLFSPFCVLCML